MENAESGFPYDGAKEHYILDIEDDNLAKEIILRLEKVTSVPKKR